MEPAKSHLDMSVTHSPATVPSLSLITEQRQVTEVQPITQLDFLFFASLHGPQSHLASRSSLCL